MEEEEREESDVAVKTLKDSDISSLVKLLREAVIMGQFCHPNVIKLYGMITEGESVRENT